MSLTQIADIIVPSDFARYSIQATTALNRFVASGIMASDPAFDAMAASAGLTHNLPFWNDIDVDAEPTNDDPSDVLVPAKLSTAQDIAAIQMRALALSDADVVTDVAGSDPMQVAINGDAKRWSANFQKIALKTLDGVFGSALAGTHVANLAVEDGLGGSAVKISANAVLDAAGLLGDRADGLTAIGLHSDVYRTLQKQNLIDYIPDARGEVNIPTYLGMRVVVDDGLPKVAGSTSGFKYTSYLFGAGALALGQAAPAKSPAVEFVREALQGNGGGVTTMVSRRKFIIHVRGVKWTGSPAGLTPTSAELATAGNWARVYDPKYIRVVKLVTNG